MLSKPELRQRLRDKRNSLSELEQQQAAVNLVEIVNQNQLLDDCQSIALYWAMDGEIAADALVTQCWSQGIKTYLPVLDTQNTGHLRFHLWDKNTQFANNQFGIPEPIESEFIQADCLDIICLPLVGFDADGNRLGMGGGFYDRTLAFIQQKPETTSPRLLGLAHEIQKEDKLVVEPWDIPLHGVITDKKYYL